jgi:adenylate kinase
MHKILILGPQGSGKGTQANLLSEKLGVPALSMGNLLRDEIGSGSDLGKEIAAIINDGNLVSDETALMVLQRRLENHDAKGGYILDGYPRNAAQNEVYKSFDQPTAMLVVTVPREESLDRMKKRAEIEQRADDTEEAMLRRLEIYENDTKPIIDTYEAQGLVRKIDGIGTVEEVQLRVNEALNI